MEYDRMAFDPVGVAASTVAGAGAATREVLRLDGEPPQGEAT
jgi:hypothetical protein